MFDRIGELQEAVYEAIDESPIVDLHTHLFAPQFEELNLSGIDELLTYHYLIAEVLRAEPTTEPEALFAKSKADQATFIWSKLFVERSPLSEAATGVITVLKALGISPGPHGLEEAREYSATTTKEEHLERVLQISGVKKLVMTNDPCDPDERALWEQGVVPDDRFLAALRIDRLIQTANLRPELDYWIARMKPRYLAISVTEVTPPPQPVLDACREHGLPFAMMIGVRRAVNPRLKLAGDGVVTVDLEPLERIAASNPDIRFLVTTLSRENTHGLCVAARKFANLLPFGCWWFLNNPSLVEETTLMRLEMLGPTFVPQHSDARVLDQLIYKWAHSRRSISKALLRRYVDADLQPAPAEIAADARALLGGIADTWLA